MKWVLGILAVVVIAMWVVWFLSVKDLKPMDDAARANAPGEFIELTDGKVHYRWSGPEDGPVVVMVHGFSTPNFIFEQNAELLAGFGHRVLQFDHFGRGWSDRPKVKYDADFYDRELLELVDGLGLEEPFGLVGLSMGGVITPEFTARHPDRVRKLFLFVPAGLEINGADGLTGAILGVPVLGDWMWQIVGRGALLGDPQYDERALDADKRLRGDVTTQMDYRGYFPALLSTMRNLPMSDRDDVFSRVEAAGVPVMAVFGVDDQTVPIASAARLKAAAPDAVVHEVEGGGHGVNYQRHDEIGPMLAGWFDVESETPTPR
jgi:pimeloyl-ACP methyl ester carboxylesterase